MLDGSTTLVISVMSEMFGTDEVRQMLGRQRKKNIVAVAKSRLEEWRERWRLRGTVPSGSLDELAPRPAITTGPAHPARAEKPSIDPCAYTAKDGPLIHRPERPVAVVTKLRTKREAGG